jgi:hypothetical protein
MSFSPCSTQNQQDFAMSGLLPLRPGVVAEEKAVTAKHLAEVAAASALAEMLEKKVLAVEKLVNAAAKKSDKVTSEHVMEMTMQGLYMHQLEQQSSTVEELKKLSIPGQASIISGASLISQASTSQNNAWKDKNPPCQLQSYKLILGPPLHFVHQVFHGYGQHS